MKVFEANIIDIKPYDKNPRVIPQEAVYKVANSIKEFGWQQPIVVDKDMVVIVGHTRLKAAEALRLGTVPCVIADKLTDEQVKAYRLADNKTNEYTQWDIDLLMSELDELVDMDFDMEQFGFDTFKETEPEEDDYDVEDELPRIETDCWVKSGDMFKLGNHRLLCGDSTSISDVTRLMAGEKADLCVTDPPYNVAVENSQGMTIKNDNMASSEFRNFLRGAFKGMYESLKEGSPFYVWFASCEHMNFEGALNDVGLKVRQEIIWRKNAFVLGRQDYQWRHEPCLYGWKDGAAHPWYGSRNKDSILDMDEEEVDKLDVETLRKRLKAILRIPSTVIDEKKPTRDGDHPTMKPIPLIGKLVSYSSRHDDIVLDLFGGSGTTLIVCEQMQRSCRMMEFDPVYCQVIIERWEKLTGQKAEKI